MWKIAVQKIAVRWSFKVGLPRCKIGQFCFSGSPASAVGPCTEVPAGVRVQQRTRSHPSWWAGPCSAFPQRLGCIFPSLRRERSDSQSSFGWHANPIIFHVCAGRGDLTTLMIAERSSSASRTFRKHISFCLACDSEKHLVDIFLWSFPIILRIYKTQTANHWQNHSFTIFWLRNNSSSLLWCFPVCVSWRQDFNTEKAAGSHPCKRTMFFFCGLSSGKQP